jgi:hypothetical protein
VKLPNFFTLPVSFFLYNHKPEPSLYIVGTQQKFECGFCGKGPESQII